MRTGSIFGRFSALALSIAALAACGDNGVVTPDAAPPIDAPNIDAPKLPTISTVPDQVIDEDTATGTLGFSVADPTGGTAGLTVTATSNNQGLVPNANVVLGGDGGSRTVTVTPAANQFGSATITLTVTSGSLTAKSEFNVTVNSINDLPTISNITNQAVQTGVATAAIPFSVGDVETAPAALTVTATSNNTTLVPNANIVFGGTGANRTVTVTPAATGTGTATITVSVNDGTASASDTFDIVVTAPTLANDPPINTVPGAQTTNEDVPLVFGPGNLISIADVDAGTASVKVTLATTIGTLTLSGTTGLTFSVGDGTADANFTFTGPITAVNTALNGLTLTTAANASGTGTLTITTDDQGNTGTGGAQSDTDQVNITVNAVNDLPTISTIGDQTISEDTATGALAFTVGDVETPAAGITVTATSSNQALVANGSLVLAGAGAARTVTATPSANAFGSSIITLTATDTDGGTSTSMFTLNVTGVNDAPTISDVADQSGNLGDTISVDFTIGDPESPATALTVMATTSNMGVTGLPTVSGTGATRTVTFTPTAVSGSPLPVITLTVSDGSLTASDTFKVTVNNVNDPPIVTVPGTQSISVVPNGTAAQRTLAFSTLNAVSVSDPDSGTANITVTVSVDAGGQVKTTTTTGVTGSGTTATSITLTGAQAAVRTALSTLQYISNTGFFGTSTITVGANDNGNSGTGGALTDSDTITVNVNASPTVSGFAPTVTVNEDGSTTVTFNVADDDGTVANIATSVTSSRPALIGNPVVVGAGAVRSITLAPNADQNSVRAGGDATLTITATDLLGGTATGAFTLHVNQANDAPVVTVPAGQQTGNEDQSIVLSGTNAIKFTDIDQAASENPNGPFSVSLSADSGAILTLASTTGISGAAGNGTTGSFTFQGTFADVTAALNGLSIKLPADQSTSTPGTLTVVVNDLGNGGAGALSDNKSLTFVFNAVNDAPTHSGVSTLATLTTNTDRTGLHVTVADIDAGSTPIITTLHSDEGTITLAPFSGLTFTTGDGSADATIVFSGTVANTNAALNGFTFSPNTNFTGDARIQVTTNDNAATGSGGALQVTSNIFTTYTAIANTAPTITAIANQTTTEDTVIGPLAFTIADAQTTADNLTVTVSTSTHYVATIGGTGANRTITVTPTQDFAATDNVTITVSDGSAMMGTQSFSVTWTAVNDAPVLAAIADITMSEDQGALTVSFSGGDVDNTITNASIAVTTDNPGLLDVTTVTNYVQGTTGTANGGGSFTVTPASDDSGTGNITVSISDGILTAQRTFKVTVNAVNDIPTVTPSGQITVFDKEQQVLRVRLSVTGAATNVISLGSTTGITFVDVGTPNNVNNTNFTPDGTVDGDGVNDHLMGIQGTIADLNAALDDAVTSGGTLVIVVDDETGAATMTSYYGTSGAAAASRVAGPFGPNPVGALTLYLTNGAYPTGSQLLSQSSANFGTVNIGGGHFSFFGPSPVNAEQWVPGVSTADTNDGTLLPATANQGWVFNTDLTGQTVAAGSWTLNAQLTSTATVFGRPMLRVSVVTGSAGAYTTVATLTETDNQGGSDVAGWDSSDSRPSVSGSGTTPVSVTFDNATAHTFAPGERLLIELGYGDSNSGTNRAWHLLYNNGNTFIQTPNIN